MLTRIDEGEVVAVEGAPGAALMAGVQDINRVVEACWGEGATSALLYAANMSPGFFDLSTREAGEVLQKLRNYNIRLALVCPPGEVAFSSRFSELLADEARGSYFGVFETRQQAVEWLKKK
ncbi:MAG TPA: DUF4180 domain-containing protein [Roseiflexaceae bacterium]|nr:DUF4180 domain-containing protein [Roseiflexaceae bacterium]